MDRSEIKIGERYAVSSAYSYLHSELVPGRIVALRVSYSYGGVGRLRNDGARVEFDEPMLHRDDNAFEPFETLAERIAHGRDRLSEEQIEDARARAFTSVVIPTRCVIELWAGREAREERERNEAARAEIAEREQADQFQTGQLAETVAKLQAVGLEPRISDDRSTLVFDGGAIEIRVGEFTDRPVSFDRRGPASIALDTLLSLVDRATVDE